MESEKSRFAPFSPRFENARIGSPKIAAWGTRLEERGLKSKPLRFLFVWQEPHKMFQNSFSMFQKRAGSKKKEDFAEPTYTRVP